MKIQEHIEKNHLHGEVVLYGTLVNLMMDQNMEKLKLAYDFNKVVGLPTCLADLELAKDDPLEDVLQITMENQELTHIPYPVNAKMIHEAILKLEDYRG